MGFTLTERPFGRIYEYSDVFMGKTVSAIVHVAEVGRIKCERCVELDLTFNREVVEKLQRLQSGGQVI
jgi:hypothetical protein